jgi:hypothetical protein
MQFFNHPIVTKIIYHLHRPYKPATTTTWHWQSLSLIAVTFIQQWPLILTFLIPYTLVRKLLIRFVSYQLSNEWCYHTPTNCHRRQANRHSKRTTSQIKSILHVDQNSISRTHSKVTRVTHLLLKASHTYN